MKIQPIVEGDGEVAAVPVLLRRLLNEASQHDWEILRPILRKRSEFSSKSGLEKAVQLALLRPECHAILIMFDSDDDCPKDMAPEITVWANDAARGKPCAVVMANREYEAWFLAAIESLKGQRGIRADADPFENPESPRDCKSELTARMMGNRTYSETVDQAALTSKFDMAAAHNSSRSFRKLVKGFGEIVGLSSEHWPPANWRPCP